MLTRLNDGNDYGDTPATVAKNLVWTKIIVPACAFFDQVPGKCRNCFKPTCPFCYYQVLLGLCRVLDGVANPSGFLIKKIGGWPAFGDKYQPLSEEIKLFKGRKSSCRLVGYICDFQLEEVKSVFDRPRVFQTLIGVFTRPENYTPQRNAWVEIKPLADASLLEASITEDRMHWTQDQELTSTECLGQDFVEKLDYWLVDILNAGHLHIDELLRIRTTEFKTPGGCWRFVHKLDSLPEIAIPRPSRSAKGQDSQKPDSSDTTSP